jgi:hypothetical protein
LDRWRVGGGRAGLKPVRAVVLPAIEQISAPEPIKITLTLESSLGEIIAVLTVGTLIGLGSDPSLVEGLITGFGHHILIDVAIGAAVGVIWSRLWPLVAGQHFSNAESGNSAGRLCRGTLISVAVACWRNWYLD